MVVVISLGLVALRFSTPSLAGVVVVLTLFGLGLAIPTAVYRRESRRAFWFGFALMGWGYVFFAAKSWTMTFGEIQYGVEGRMEGEFENGHEKPILAHWLPTTAFLDAVRPWVQLTSGSDVPLRRVASIFGFTDSRSNAIYTVLNRPVPMSFADETSLADVLKYIKAETRNSALPDGIPIYVEPVGLEEAERTMDSPISLEIKGVPLRSSLPLLLRQLDLKFTVDDGLLTITSRHRRVPYDNESIQSFRRVGHCLFALIFALVGGFATRILHATRPTAPTAPPSPQ